MKNNLRQSVALLFIGLALFTFAAWMTLAGLAAGTEAAVLSVGSLSYLLGLRHGFDADHIAAIDNVTRKLRQDGKRCVTTGLYFALGHSTMVMLMSFVLVMAARSNGGRGFLAGVWGGELSKMVSAAFLTIVGIVNIAIFMQLRKITMAQTSVDGSGAVANGEVEALLCQRGCAGRLFASLYRRIEASWQMYPVGFLFGLGFDTATEIAMLGFSAEAASSGKLPIWAIMIFPLMFTAGMTMVDAMDGALMMGMYDWAFSDSRKKLFFNTTITGLSALVALTVALIEWAQLSISHMEFLRPLRTTMSNLDFSAVGLTIAALMLAVWCFGLAIYWRRSVVSSSSAARD